MAKYEPLNKCTLCDHEFDWDVESEYHNELAFYYRCPSCGRLFARYFGGYAKGSYYIGDV